MMQMTIMTISARPDKICCVTCRGCVTQSTGLWNAFSLVKGCVMFQIHLMRKSVGAISGLGIYTAIILLH